MKKKLILLIIKLGTYKTENISALILISLLIPIITQVIVVIAKTEVAIVKIRTKFVYYIIHCDSFIDKITTRFLNK